MGEPFRILHEKPAGVFRAGALHKTKNPVGLFCFVSFAPAAGISSITWTVHPSYLTSLADKLAAIYSGSSNPARETFRCLAAVAIQKSPTGGLFRMAPHVRKCSKCCNKKYLVLLVHLLHPCFRFRKWRNVPLCTLFISN